MSITLNPRSYERDIAVRERVQSLKDIPWQQFAPHDRALAEATRADLIARVERGEAIVAYNTTPRGQWLIEWPGSRHMTYTPAECVARYLARVEVRA